MKSGEKLLLALRQCDTRFVSDLKDLQDNLESGQDVIQLGIQGQQCHVQSQAFWDEFSDHQRGLVAAHFSALIDYVAQFPEWSRYLEKAASAKILEQDMVDSLRLTLTELRASVASNPAVDHSVIGKLDWLASLVEDGRPVTKKVVLAVAWSVQNLASIVVKFASGLVQGVVKKTGEVAVTGVTFVSIAVVTHALIPFVPISTVLARNQWLSEALEWLGKIWGTISGG